MNKDPVFVVVDIRSLLQISNLYPKLFTEFPIRDLIELLLTIPFGMNIDDFIEEEIKARFSILELTKLDPTLIEIVIETIDNEIYMILNNSSINTDKNSYLFFSWLDEYTILLAREDKIFDGVSSNELYQRFKISRTLSAPGRSTRFRFRSRV